MGGCVFKITLVALKLGNYCGFVMMIGLATTRGSQRGGGNCRKWILHIWFICPPKASRINKGPKTNLFTQYPNN